MSHFTKGTFRFLRALKRNNDRAWFQAHREDHEKHLKAPFQAFIIEMASPLEGISRHYVADPRGVGGSLFRIHRDTRFSKEKRPYKTWSGARFFHADTRSTARTAAAQGRLDAPVFYLHLEPGGCYLGGGIWHPQSPTARAVRHYLAANPRSWTRATRSATFRRHFKLGGDSLKRPPRGMDPEHPLIVDLMRKDFVASHAFDEKVACRSGFGRYVMTRYRALGPMIDVLCGALDLPY